MPSVEYANELRIQVGSSSRKGCSIRSYTKVTHISPAQVHRGNRT